MLFVLWKIKKDKLVKESGLDYVIRKLRHEKQLIQDNAAKENVEQ